MRGTTKRSRQEIEDTFDKLRAKVGVTGSQTGASALAVRPSARNCPTRCG